MKPYKSTLTAKLLSHLLSKTCFCLFALLMLQGQLDAQLNWLLGDTESSLAVEGNQAYEEGDYLDAELKYKQSLRKSKDGEMEAVIFNLGGALYHQGEERYGEALEQFNMAINKLKTKEGRSAAFYNMGNTQMHLQEIEDAIESYKEALKLNPSDMDSKYNLAYAQWLMSQPQQQENSQCNNPKEGEEGEQKEQEQKKDQQEQQEQGEQQEQKEGEEKEQEEKEQQEQQEQQEQKEGESKEGEEEREKEESEKKEGEEEQEPKPGEEEEQEEQDQEAKAGEEGGEKVDSTEARPIARAMTREEVDKILDRLKKEELEVQEKLLRKNTTGQTKSGKDW